MNDEQHLALSHLSIHSTYLLSCFSHNAVKLFQSLHSRTSISARLEAWEKTPDEKCVHRSRWLFMCTQEKKSKFRGEQRQIFDRANVVMVPSSKISPIFQIQHSNSNNGHSVILSHSDIISPIACSLSFFSWGWGSHPIMRNMLASTNSTDLQMRYWMLLVVNSCHLIHKSLLLEWNPPLWRHSGRDIRLKTLSLCFLN